jgi:Ca2+-binding EF-hand superfamily protein
LKKPPDNPGGFFVYVISWGWAKIIHKICDGLSTGPPFFLYTTPLRPVSGRILMSTTSAISGTSGQSQAALLQLIQQLRQAAAQKTSATTTSSTDTTNSSAAAQALTQFFQSSDTDGNGQLSQSELSSGLQSASSNLLSGSNLLQASDPSSGNTAQDAIQALISSIQSQLSSGTSSTDTTSPTDPKEKFAAALFKQLDGNGDGSVTQDEVESAVTKAGGTKEAADALYAKLDPDNTGSVTEQQVAENLPPPPRGGHGPHRDSDSASSSSSSGTTTYDPLDTNQDGTVSETERLAGLGITTDSADDTGSGSNTGSADSTESPGGFFAQIRKEMMNFLISLQTQAGNSSETGGASA